MWRRTERENASFIVTLVTDAWLCIGNMTSCNQWTRLTHPNIEESETVVPGVLGVEVLYVHFVHPHVVGLPKLESRGVSWVQTGTIRYALRKKLRYYLGIFPKGGTPPPPLLGTPYSKKKFIVYFAF